MSHSSPRRIVLPCPKCRGDKRVVVRGRNEELAARRRVCKTCRAKLHGRRRCEREPTAAEVEALVAARLPTMPDQLCRRGDASPRVAGVRRLELVARKWR